MIGVDEAVIKAHGFFQSLFKGAGVRDLRVEEVELSDDRRYWLITLGFVPRNADDIPFPVRELKREYKVFRVNSDSGEVEAMKMRIVA